MKSVIKAVVTILVLTASTTAFAVNGYYRADGTYVQPYQRSQPDQYRYNNLNSQSHGGKQRDEFSNPPTFNQSNPQNPNYYQYQQPRKW